jgi:4-aminobutyrate aminotransferase-like enzyme
LSAVTGKAEIMDAPAAGGLGGTYGGSPIGCAAAHAVLDVIAEEKLVERCPYRKPHPALSATRDLPDIV